MRFIRIALVLTVAYLPTLSYSQSVPPQSPLTGVKTGQSEFRVVYKPDTDAYYPSYAKRAGEVGKVVVRLIINEEGHVEEVTLVRESDFPRLNRAATDIGRRYRFKPFLVNGVPTKLSTNLAINFRLKDLTPEEARQALNENPNNVHALNCLGYYLANKNENLNEAYELLSKANKLAPKDSDILDSLGWANYRLGNNALALEQIQQAFTIDPSAEIGAHLGELLWKAGKFSDAQKVWGQAIKANPNDPVLKETMQRLQGAQK